MDRRSFCKVLGFAAGSTLLPGLMVQAAGQSSVGHAVPDGRYTIGIRSDLSGCDLTHAFYYSDSFFAHPATQYDHQLALATLGLVCAAANTVAKFCVSRENFHQKYEAAIMDMIQCAFIRSEKEVVDGYILSDGEIVERLQSLSHMKEIDYWQIVGSVWAASTMSRPILERYGQNVPLLARQILIPVLAVGLCYGIETDVVQMVAQYIIRLLTARGELDSVLRAAFCHHPENYISLMEYYTPEEHGMEPFTRK